MATAETDEVRAPPVAGVVDVNLTTYQLALSAFRLPVSVHALANALTAAGILLLGHPMLAACLFVGATAFDAAMQRILGHWFAESVGADETAGHRRLALLSLARTLAYTAPTLAMVLAGRGVAELMLFGLQLATLLMVAGGASALSPKIFWAFAAPMAIEVLVVAAVLLPPIAVLALLPAALVLLAVFAVSSSGASTTISNWHRAFMQSVAERAAADAAREAAAEASQARSAFLATMSHEIRTPMNGVLGMARLLRRDEANPGQAERLDVLIQSGEHLLAILNDVLDVARIDAGRLEIVAAPTDLHGLLDRLVAFWTPRAQERGLELNLRMTPETPAWVMADAVRLRQILFNLVGNALKFTDSGSVDVIVHATRRGPGEARVRLSVRDTGPGIAEEQVPRLFDRFSQADRSDERRHGGAGLGLAIVRQLVELMDGRVWVETELGTGSTFHVELPLDLASAPAEEPDADEHLLSAPFPRLRILAVDDNPVNLMVLDQLLSSLDLVVESAASGPEALAALAGSAYDLVLSDIQMPGMTGLDLLRRLRAAPGPNQATPVIALTADVASGGRQRYLDQGFTDHCAKPIELADLLEAIGRATSASAAALAEPA
ncbi:ATP-binding protein [Phenylobacterium kunshanense]|uniref:histidine kinase n=1 Tax=Phenylobacterium kunshanense TaxID=1445034 RepID=A0A328BA28_9CAUL|nr:ATP-binding protein [Phenylobacterium kunshanense]RAK64300.1 hybrid sensor histidine kinase/response regulator [Phenylobacterium kunshanense]